MAKITNLELASFPVDLGHPLLAAAARELYGPQLDAGLDPLPLCEQELSFECAGVSSPEANAFQRVMTQELTGCYLHAEASAMDGSTDPFFKPELVITLRLTNVPLAHDVTLAAHPDLEMALDVTNTSDTTREVLTGEIAVTRGSLARPIFNPNIVLASLQPGKRLVISKIVLAENLGRTLSAASVAVRGRSVPLDLERLPRERCFKGLQGDAERSGYVLSSAVANPRRFKVTVVVKAAPKGSQAARRLPARACHNIIKRLRQVLEIITRAPLPGEAGGAAIPSTEVSNWAVSSADGVAQGDLTLRGETDTIVEILRSRINEAAPDLAFVGAVKGADPSITGLTVRRHGDTLELQAIVQKAVNELIALYGQLLACVDGD